jgi:flavin-binding protein dodecin
VSAHAGADAGADELAPDAVGGAGFKPLDKNGNREWGRVSDQQMHVVGFAVELYQLDVEFGADITPWWSRSR